MNSSRIIGVSAVMLASGLLVAAHAAETDQGKKYAPPKTEFGQPDLRGVWNFSSDTPLERPGLPGMRRNFHAALARQPRP